MRGWSCEVPTDRIPFSPRTPTTHEPSRWNVRNGSYIRGVRPLKYRPHGMGPPVGPTNPVVNRWKNTVGGAKGSRPRHTPRPGLN